MLVHKTSVTRDILLASLAEYLNKTLLTSGLCRGGYWWGNWKTGNDILDNLIFPLQWAIDSRIGGFSSNTARPSTKLFKGEFGPNHFDHLDNDLAVQGGSVFWVSLVAMFVGPIFILILIGVVYHLAVFVATVSHAISPQIPPKPK